MINFNFNSFQRLHASVLLAVTFGLILLIARVYVTQSTFYVFLVWNLFLACVPYGISQLARYSKTIRSSGFLSGGAFLLWLVFFPNSPYIITDLIHLHSKNSTLLWFDLFLVFIFAINGLLVGLLSLLDVFEVLRQRYSLRIAHYSIFQLCILCGYGIYVGRFLRFNSWDILTQPISLLKEMAYSFYSPHIGLFTFAFGGFIWVLFLVFQALVPSQQTVGELRK